MDKPWEEQSQAEKIETLRNQINLVGARVNGFDFRLSDLAGEVQYLKKKLESKGGA